MPIAENGAFQVHGYCRTLVGKPMLEVEPSGQRVTARLPRLPKWSKRGHIVYGHRGDISHC